MGAFLYIYRVTLLLILFGGEILILDVMHFWVCLYFSRIGLHT